MLTCSYGPDIEGTTLEKGEKLSNTSPQFFMYTYVLDRVHTDYCGAVFADLLVFLVILSPEHLSVPHGLHIWLSQCLQHFNIAKLLAYLGQDGR